MWIPKESHYRVRFFWTIGQHQMRCLRVKYIETFPIENKSDF
jgi:hypothetical protein